MARNQGRWPGWLLMLVLFSGCASLEESVSQKIEYIVPKSEAAPGDVYPLGFVVPEEVKSGYLRFLDKSYRMYPRKDLGKRTFTSFLPIPNINPGKYMIECYFTVGKEKKQIADDLTVEILPDYRKHPLDEVRGQKFSADGYVRERAEILAALKPAAYAPGELQNFLLPMGGEVVSDFGTIRRYGGQAEVALEGLEIKPVSNAVTEVSAAADGKILLAEKMPMLGNVVVMDHGFSFATVYCHLQVLAVKPGQIVRRGGRLGQAGATGGAAKDKRLYYQLLVAGTPVDVRKFTKIDFFHSTSPR